MKRLGVVIGENMSGTSFCKVASSASSKSAKFCHEKARSETYPASQTKRFVVPDDKVKWNVEFNNYSPVDYTAEAVSKGPVWADPDIRTSSKIIKFNTIDGKVNRKSFMGDYLVKDGIPQNPCGRTGITGRGLLGKWGPNHAADPIVTRWKRNSVNDVVEHSTSKKRILQFVAIQRKDTKEWAIPGGMVDANETVSVTLKREFGEEALNSLELSDAKKKELEKQISNLFNSGVTVYEGYVDDPRNTDNAWMETVAVNFHDDTGLSVGSLPLHAGDDAGAVQWMDIDSSLSLFASHSYFLKEVASRHKSHW